MSELDELEGKWGKMSLWYCKMKLEQMKTRRFWDAIDIRLVAALRRVISRKELVSKPT